MSMWDCKWQMVMCWGQLKILCIVRACMCKLHICQHPHSYQVWSSQGFPTTLSPVNTHSIPQCLVSSSCVPVFTACCSVWRGSGYRQSDDFFPITLHQHSTTCISDNKTMCLRAGQRSEGVWGRRTWTLNLWKWFQSCWIHAAHL